MYLPNFPTNPQEPVIAPAPIEYIQELKLNLNDFPLAKYTWPAILERPPTIAPAISVTTTAGIFSSTIIAFGFSFHHCTEEFDTAKIHAVFTPTGESLLYLHLSNLSIESFIFFL